MGAGSMDRPVLTLAVTTSTAVVGVAIGHVGPGGAEVVASAEVETDRRHAEELTPLIVDVSRRAGVELGDIEQYVVDVGPGRFTGLRVGLASVRTLALAFDRPVIGVTSLEVLAGAVPTRPVVAVVDARRAEVFQQRFDADGPAGPPVVGSPADLAPAAEPGLVVVGDGADRYPDHYRHGVVPGRNPSAEVMVTLAVGRSGRPGPEVEPRYLRSPDVNVNVKTRATPR